MAKKTAKQSTALAKRAPVKKKATSLIKSKPAAAAIVPVAPTPVPAAQSLAQQMGLSHVLEDGMVLGDLGLVEVKLTAEEERILGEPIALEDLRVKPDGAVYLPHTAYARWLTHAFGRTGWGMRPAGLPKVAEGLVVQPHILLIHGKPVKAAWGEQEYHEKNRNQSYGDAIEATRANALRRCCKQLSMGLELWDREGFIQPYLEEHAVKLWNNEKSKYEWRRKLDKPFPWETKDSGHKQRREEQRRPAQPVDPVAHHGKENDPITDAQRVRFVTIARQHHRQDGEVKAYLHTKGYTSSKEIKRKDYETMCAALEHPGPLPGTIIDVESRREPGEEG